MSLKNLRILLLGCLMTVLSSLAALAEPASVVLDGQVKESLQLTLRSVRERWPDGVQPMSYQVKDRQEKGYAIALLSLLDAAKLDVPAEPKNAKLSFVCLAVGEDGYRAAVALGELLPEVGNRPVYVVWSEDGENARLLVPSDAKFSRSVYGLKEIRVIQLTPAHP